MNNKAISIIIGITIGIILVATILVPTVEEGTKTIDTRIASNTGYSYSLSDEFGEEITIEISNGAKVNGAQVTATGNNPTYTVISDKFSILWWESDANVKVSDVDLGLISGVTKIVIHADKTYSLWAGTQEYAATSTLSHILYPSNDGAYGFFKGVAAHIDLGSKWYYCEKGLGMSPWYNMICNYEGDNAEITVTESYVKISSNFEECSTTITYTNTPELSEDGLSYVVSNASGTRTVSVNGTDYTSSTSANFIAAKEYHYLEVNVASAPLLNAIPIIVIISLLLSAIGLVTLRRD